VEERSLFVARLIEGEAIADLAREFGVSRKTGYWARAKSARSWCAAAARAVPTSRAEASNLTQKRGAGRQR